MKNSILLILGVLATLLFVVFSTNVFEQLYYDNVFSNEMYNGHLYFVVALVTAIVAWVAAALFYYIINSVSFSRWYHWLTVLAVSSVLTAIINFVYPHGVFADNGKELTAQLFSFCVVDMVVAAVLFIIASFSIRWWSSNCRHTPIPE